MSIQTTCCVTGHRRIPEEKVQFVRDELRREIHAAVGDGFTHFISGFADGVDLLFAEQVVALQDEGQEITLEAAIPYRNRIKNKDGRFQSLLARCSMMGITAEEYTSTCCLVRNQYMVQHSARIIAVYDGRERGGTSFTMRYSREMERELHIINL